MLRRILSWIRIIAPELFLEKLQVLMQLGNLKKSADLDEGASFSENFYGLKRVLIRSRTNICLLKSRIRSLCFLVVIPYLKSKLDKYFDKLNEDHDRLRKTAGIKRRILESFLRLYPKLCTCFELWTLILQVGYLIHKTDTHSPWIYMAGIILRTTSGAEFQPPSGISGRDGIDSCIKNRIVAYASLIWSKSFGWLSKMLGMALLYVQFLDWWQSNEREKNISLTLPIPDAPHNLLLSENSILKMNPQTCPICRSRRKNDTVLSVSGYIFCYSCIFQHLKRRKYCPVTRIPASLEHLVRLFVSSADKSY